MRSAEQEFRERNKVVELAQVQAGSEQECRDASRGRRAGNISVVAQPAEFFGKAYPSRYVPGKGARSAVVVERFEAPARMEIHVVEHARDFKSGHNSARRRRFVRFGVRRKGLGPRSLGQRKKSS